MVMHVHDWETDRCRRRSLIKPCIGGRVRIRIRIRVRLRIRD